MARNKLRGEDIPDNENWRNFLNLYRDMPELWDPQHRKGKSKEACYAKLLEAYQVIHKNATIANLKERLRNFRMSYFKAARKLISERKLGRKYVPKLWYFDLLKFLWIPEGREDGQPYKILTIPDNPAWEIFFDFYRGLPELWDSTLVSFRDKRKRNQSLARLLDIYRMICKDATLEDMKKRLNSIRITYRKEARKAEEERKINPSYKPCLWYFEYLDFVSYPDARVDPETRCQVGVNEDGQMLVNDKQIYKETSDYPHTRPALTYEESKKKLESYLESESYLKSRQEEEAKKEPNKKKRKRKLESDFESGSDWESRQEEEAQKAPNKRRSKLAPQGARNEARSKVFLYSKDLFSLQKQGREPKDEASVYGESWAASYRSLSDVQKIYAKKAIEDILTLGQLDSLAINTVDVSSANGNAPKP